MGQSGLERAGTVDRLAAVAAEGGWRLFMRRAAPEHAAALDRAGARGGGLAQALQLARAFVLAKEGRVREARGQIEATRETIARHGPEDPSIPTDVVLVDAHLRVYEDRVLTERDALRLRRALDRLPEHDLIGQALALNQLCAAALHMGHFDQGQEYAEMAIRLYRQGDAEFGSLHLHTHLGQIKLLRGDLAGAEAQYGEMEARLAGLPDGGAGLLAIGRALRSEVRYETSDLAESARLLSQAIGSVEDSDAWLDVLASAYRVRTRLAFIDGGLPAALTELAHCERVAINRDMPRLRRLMQIERIRALTLSDELDAAAAEMRTIGLTADRLDWDEGGDWALRQGTAIVAIARWLVRARRAHEALAFLDPAEDFAIRGGQLLPLAKLRVVRAAAHWTLNQKVPATSALLSAIRLLGRQPFRRFILDEGPVLQAIVLAALDGEHVAVPPTGPQRHRLAELAHHWATAASVRPGLPGRRSTPNDGDRGDPLRRRYLELLALGHSNKEIGRVMGVSPNTVKYHLKLLFRDLRVDNRGRAVHRARELGLLGD